jgi:chromosome segregation protein
VYLKSLEMLGFKSFAEAKIQFPQGITAIVGPNGSGKSNVVDAILWVLGEQSTKTLRSERMEDVIFNGTELRKPLGMSEVSLVIGGLADLRLDVVAGMPSQLGEYQELMITRRLYRNGDSEYLINKTACRLKDIRSVLMETRAGTKGHTVIEQGRIDQILNASPQDRRELIEETAGIVRYKKQKAEALRKLDATQQNLLRVRDIIAEVKKQLTSLERQARQARSFQTLQQEARTLEIELLTRDYRLYRAGLDAVEGEAQALATQEATRLAEQARLDSEQEEVRLRISAIGDAITRVREELGRAEQQQAQAQAAGQIERSRIELFDRQRTQASQELARVVEEQQQAAGELDHVQARLAQVEGEMTGREQEYSALDRAVQQLASQRAAAVAAEERGRLDVLNLAVLVANTEQGLAQMEAKLEEIAAREQRAGRDREELERVLTALGDRRETLASQRIEVGDRIALLTDRRKEIRSALEETTERIAELEQQVTRQSAGLAATDSRLQAIQGVVREEMGYGREGEEEGTALRACDGVHDALAEWLQIPPGFDRAVEAVLGERVRGWLVDEPAQAGKAVEFLKSKELGRGSFIPRLIRWNDRRETTEQDWWATLSQESGVVGRAVDLIGARDGSRAPLSHFFEGVVFVEHLEIALALWERHQWTAPDGPTLVTLSGEVIDAAGVVTGGATAENGGLLQRRREVLDLQTQRDAVRTALEESRSLREQAMGQAAALREADQQASQELREAEMLELSVQKDETGVDQQRADLRSRVDVLSEELAASTRERSRLEQELASGRAQLSQWMAEKNGQEATLAQVRSRLGDMEREMSARQQQLTEARLALEGLRSRREHGRADMERLQQEQAAAAGRVASLEEQLAGLAASIEQSAQEATRQEALYQECDAAVHRIKAELIGLQERQAEEMAAIQQIEQSLADTRHALNVIRDNRMAVEVRRAEMKTHLSTLESTLTGTYQLDLALLAAPPPVDANEAAGTDDKERTRLLNQDTDELREQLRKIRERLDRMGAINLAAIDEHRELEERYGFLTSQEQDLSRSIASLKEIIQRINRTTKDMFVSTFNELQQKFGEVFMQFFPGGRAELRLVEEEPEEGAEQEGGREPGVDIVAQPPGKRLKSITMLSGGEKTLTAMALLFASFLIRPTPFCILDEIDAPLDEENIGRFTAVLRELSAGAQFLVITHNKRTMAMADSLFGVTMEDPGVSKLISVKLGDLQPA